MSVRLSIFKDETARRIPDLDFSGMRSDFINKSEEGSFMLRSGKGVVFLVFAAFVLIAAVPAEARTWQVKPSMTRLEIQHIFDLARDGDRIQFHKGVYDFTDGPWLPVGTNGAAIVITDKSLVVKGQKGVVIKGRGEVPKAGQESEGITAFQVINPDRTKDIVFENLTFETFMLAITTSRYTVYPAVADNVHDVTVRNCVFRDIRRNAATFGLNSGDVTLVGNTVEDALRIGFYVTWYDGWQPDSGLVEVSNNTIRAGVLGLFVARSYAFRIADNVIEGIGSNPQWGLSVEGQKAVGLIAGNMLRNFQGALEIYAADDEPFAGAVVDGNTITGVRPNGFGIIIDGASVHDCLVEDNAIATTAGSWCAIYTDGHNNRFLNNILTGEGEQAVLLSYWDADIAAHNEFFEGNSVAGYTPTVAHYCFDYWTHHNTVHAICSENATVIDYTEPDSTNVFACLNSLLGSSFEVLGRILGRMPGGRIHARVDW